MWIQRGNGLREGACFWRGEWWEGFREYGKEACSEVGKVEGGELACIGWERS